MENRLARAMAEVLAARGDKADGHRDMAAAGHSCVLSGSHMMFSPVHDDSRAAWRPWLLGSLGLWAPSLFPLPLSRQARLAPFPPLQPHFNVQHSSHALHAITTRKRRALVQLGRPPYTYLVPSLV